jgi:NAD(P)H dehydrogenase (quinone)
MTTPVKLAVIYYSSTGTITEIAKELHDAGVRAGAEVRLAKAGELAPQDAIDSNPAWAANQVSTTHIPEATVADVEWADAVIFGTPTRFGNVSSQLKQFIDTLGGLWAEGKLADKVYSGFVSTATAHAGHESTLAALYTSVHHFGGILVTPGFTDPAKFVDGNPYGTSHTDGQGTIPVDDAVRTAARIQVERVIRTTAKLKAAAEAEARAAPRSHAAEESPRRWWQRRRK